MTDRMFPPSDSLLSDVKKEQGVKHGETENKTKRVQKARATGNLWGSMVTRRDRNESEEKYTIMQNNANGSSDRSPNKHRRPAGRDTRVRVYNELDNPAARRNISLTPDQIKQEAEFVLRHEGPPIMSAPDDILVALVIRAMNLEKEVSKQLASRTELLGKMQVMYDQEMEETRASLNLMEMLVRESAPGSSGPSAHQRAVVHEMRMKLIDADSRQEHSNKENVVVPVSVDVSRPPPVLNTSVPPPIAPQINTIHSARVNVSHSIVPVSHSNVTSASSATHPYAGTQPTPSSFNPSLPPPNMNVPPPTMPHTSNVNSQAGLPVDVKILPCVTGMLSCPPNKTNGSTINGPPSAYSGPPPLHVPPPPFVAPPPSSSSSSHGSFDTSKPPPVGLNRPFSSAPVSSMSHTRFGQQGTWTAGPAVGGHCVSSGPITPFVNMAGHRRPYPGMGMIGRPGNVVPRALGGLYNRPPPGISPKQGGSYQTQTQGSEERMEDGTSSISSRESRKRPLENSAGW